MEILTQATNEGLIAASKYENYCFCGWSMIAFHRHATTKVEPTAVQQQFVCSLQT